MCGICGIFNFEKKNNVNPEIVKRMSEVIQHRGPDEDGYYVKDNIGFGHKRLSIIDLRSGQQPIFNEDKTCCIIFNGEIYNFQEIRKILENKDHIFRTLSDTEVIIHSYEEYGTECVSHFRGMFAFAIWDANKNTLFIARDRLGKKPLYYYFNDDCFIFASEVKSILQSGIIKAEVNENYIDEFLSLGYVTAPNTLFKNIKKIPPSYFLTAKDAKVTLNEYWFLNGYQTGNLTMQEYQHRLVSLLEESVKYRLISDVPLGAFLSGGIDSSIIVGLMSSLSDRPVKTFSVGYRNQGEFSELQYAKKVAEFFATQHNEIILEPVDFYDAIPKMVWSLDEPISDQACIPLWLLAKEAKKHVTVLLSGEGSDELFAGYPIYSLMNAIDQYRRLPHWMRKYAFDPLIPKIFGERRGQKYLEWTKLALEERYLGDMADLSSFTRNRLYSEGPYDIACKNPVAGKLKIYYDAVSSSDSLSRMQYLDIKTWLVDDLLLKADKMTMAASVELRCPFLDHTFVEFSRTIPSKFKLNGTTSKYILKEAFKKFLPKEIIHRKKRGFPVPLNSWFQGDLNKLISEVLLDTKSINRGYFNAEFIREIIEKQKNKIEDYSKLLWSLLVLEFWHKVFIDAGN
jgi:asparagine synthase (glutamine-hydrolysing)